MASGAKRKTTMAKLTRERAVLEKRHRKAAKREARKAAAAAAASEPPLTPNASADTLANGGESAAGSA